MLNTFTIDDMSHGKIGFINLHWIVCFVKCLYTYMVIRCILMVDSVPGIVLQSSATYWEGKADAESLQRIYGISFPDPKQLKEWKHFQEEAAKRDHRKIGKVRCQTVSSCKAV